MSAACCAFVKPAGDPCAAHALPGSAYCLFHDPARTDALADGRRKGGAAPRRRTRRFPRVLDHLHVAELLGELFVDALNDPDAFDTKRLQAFTNLCRVLLKAVGVPKDAPMVHPDRAEPAAAADHLLRVYPSLSPETVTLLDAEPCSVIASEGAMPDNQVIAAEPARPQAGEQEVEQALDRLGTGPAGTVADPNGTLRSFSPGAARTPG